MPIAICYTHDKIFDKPTLQRVATEWAALIEVDTKDIHISIVSPQIQAGQAYKAMVHLFLPTLWTREAVNKIQLSLHQMLMKHANLTSSEIFVITTLVPSGQVVENGCIIHWADSSIKNDSSVL